MFSIMSKCKNVNYLKKCFCYKITFKHYHYFIKYIFFNWKIDLKPILYIGEKDILTSSCFPLLGTIMNWVRKNYSGSLNHSRTKMLKLLNTLYFGAYILHDFKVIFNKLISCAKSSKCLLYFHISLVSNWRPTKLRQECLICMKFEVGVYLMAVYLI